MSSAASFRHFLGGLLAHARDVALLFAPNPNSYKRYRPGTFAPTAVAWAYDNRTAGFRVVGQGPSLRVECRIPARTRTPTSPTRGCSRPAWTVSSASSTRARPSRATSTRPRGLPQVPATLPEAIEAFSGSDFTRKAFGDEVVDHLAHFARTELRQVDDRVSDVERARYFERI